VKTLLTAVLASSLAFAQGGTPPPASSAVKPAVAVDAGVAKAADVPTVKPAAPTSAELNKTLYVFGMMLAKRSPIESSGFSEAELKEIFRGISDAALGKKTEVKIEEYAPKLEPLFNARAEARAVVLKKKEAEVLAKAALEKGAQKLPSGVVVVTTKPATGAMPASTDTVKVHYRGTLLDGTEFDSSYKRGEPIEFPLTGVVKCWTEGVAKMNVGSKAKLVCPSDTAYGTRGQPPTIPPNSTLQFEVELISIKGK
jgi:FKBP-type peptidyl-prolyl cis-trans isomerase FkpA